AARLRAAAGGLHHAAEASADHHSSRAGEPLPHRLRELDLLRGGPARADHGHVGRRHLTTRFTSLPGTTIAFTTWPPSRCAFTFSDSRARRSCSSSGAPVGTTSRSRTLPFTCTTSSNVSVSSSDPSASGHGCSHTRSPVIIS